ncbi:HK97 family phage major capsid protein [Micromonospora sp. A200]|uniref:phage major capsid protein n=1 Tax=Micromonospora sp. A200 TaxID=2940568 RepID=UPI0024752E0F|nr:phage major capsid protein [Micromonospora sp. A200]MDH6461769.1 HK97 family phage major capsid protein [Micromonospora sp. A200]
MAKRWIADVRSDREAVTEKYDRCRSELNEIHRSATDRELTAGEQERFDRLSRGLQNASDEIAKLRDEEMDMIRQLAENPANREGGSVGQPYGHDASRARGAGERDQALRTIERSAKAGMLVDHAAERATELVERSGAPADQSIAARWVTTTGDEAYRSAFVKMLADPVRGHMLWTQQEQAAYQAVAGVQAEMSRAMSLTDASGGYMVPLTLDPALNLTSDGSVNPLRRIARVVQTATESWTGLTTAGATSEWKAEAAQAADGSPAVDDTPIPVHFGDTFVPYSYEIGMDGRNFLEELRKVMLDSADQLMATAYTTGSGSGQPKGIVTALAGTASEINTTGTEAIVASDAFALQNALPARFQARAQWAMHLAIINTFRQFETTAGALKFPEITNGQLLNRRLNELSNMDGSISATATANNYVALYGDFSNFVIVDRIGTTLELIPNLVGANGRPTGQRGAFLWFRTGSDVLVPQAFRMLDVPTTA